MADTAAFQDGFLDRGLWRARLRDVVTVRQDIAITILAGMCWTVPSLCPIGSNMQRAVQPSNIGILEPVAKLKLAMPGLYLQADACKQYEEVLDLDMAPTCREDERHQAETALEKAPIPITCNCRPSDNAAPSRSNKASTMTAKNTSPKRVPRVFRRRQRQQHNNQTRQHEEVIS